MKIISVINNRVVNPFKVMINQIIHGYIKLSLYSFFSVLFNKTCIGNYFTSLKHKTILKYLEKKYLFVLEKYEKTQIEDTYDELAPIWVLWMQGEEKAPKLVKKCICSIKKSTNHPVVVLTNENLLDYCKLPDYIIGKYESGIITNAQLTDIIRMTLLSDCGGLWIDATVFIPNKIPEDIFKYGFYSCKRNTRDCGYVSKYQWTSFLNGCHRKGIVQSVVKNLFFEYWKENDYLIDYLLVDYFIRLVYNNLPEARSLIDNLPYNNEKIEELQARMNLAFNQKEYDKLINESNTNFFKLSWRIPFDNEDKNGNMTYFGHFINRT